MDKDYFASNGFSSILSWILCIPALFAIIAFIFSTFRKHEDVPWLFSAWVGLCFLWLSPIRYMLFQLVTAISYPVQSWPAFLSTFGFGVVVLVPIAFVILGLVGFSLPLFLVFLVVGEKPLWWRYALASVSAPALALLGSIGFGFLLPFAASLTTYHLRGEDIIRSTNGPAYYVFTYLVADIESVEIPRYFERTPRRARDYLRTHVAYTYLSQSEHQSFVERAYPKVLEELSGTR